MTLVHLRICALLLIYQLFLTGLQLMGEAQVSRLDLRMSRYSFQTSALRLIRTATILKGEAEYMHI